MPKLILRSFLYLDETALDQYLSQIRGGVLEGPYSSKDTTSQDIEGKAGANAHFLSAGGQKSQGTSSEIERTIRVTAEAKFSELYSLLKGKSPEDSQMQTLNGFDEEIYRTVETGEVVEVRGQGRLPQWEHLKKTINDLSGLLEVMKLAGQNPFDDPQARLGYEGMSILAAKQGNDGTILMVTPLNASKFTIFARLEPDKILRRKEDLEADVTLLGKVQRVLSPGEKVDAFRLMPELTALMNSSAGNRANRRAAGKSKSKAVDTASPWDEFIKYPAIQVQPIAVFQ